MLVREVTYDILFWAKSCSTNCPQLPISELVFQLTYYTSMGNRKKERKTPEHHSHSWVSYHNCKEKWNAFISELSTLSGDNIQGHQEGT